MADRRAEDLLWRCTACGEEAPDLDTGPCPACGHRMEVRGGVVRAAPGWEPAGFRDERREHLTGIEGDHFWFPPRRKLLAGLLDDRPGEPAGSPGGAAIELGCGTGGFLPVLTRRFDRVVAVDAYGESLERAPSGDGIVRIQGDVTRVPLAGGRFRLAVALDVLEHVDPDAFLAEAARLVAPGGRLLLSVPALPALWSELDEAAGHRCRYTRSRLAAELGRAGWALEHWTHYQLALLPLVWLTRKSPWRRARTTERHPPRVLGRALGAVNALEVRLFGRRRLPAGSSLVAVGRREAA